MRKSIQRLLFSYRGYCHLPFFIALYCYVGFSHPGWPEEGGYLDQGFDVTGFFLIIIGLAVRGWAVSRAGKDTRSRTLKAKTLVTNGPYAYSRNPIYLGNLCIALGLTVVADAFFLIPLLLGLFFLMYLPIVCLEEEFLLEKFGERYRIYCQRVPRFIPALFSHSSLRRFLHGDLFPLKEMGTIVGMLAAGMLAELLEHHYLQAALYHFEHSLLLH